MWMSTHTLSTGLVLRAECQPLIPGGPPGVGGETLSWVDLGAAGGETGEGCSHLSSSVCPWAPTARSTRPSMVRSCPPLSDCPKCWSLGESWEPVIRCGEERAGKPVRGEKNELEISNGRHEARGSRNGRDRGVRSEMMSP